MGYVPYVLVAYIYYTWAGAMAYSSRSFYDEQVWSFITSCAYGADGLSAE